MVSNPPLTGLRCCFLGFVLFWGHTRILWRRNKILSTRQYSLNFSPGRACCPLSPRRAVAARRSFPTRRLHRTIFVQRPRHQITSVEWSRHRGRSPESIFRAKMSDRSSIYMKRRRLAWASASLRVLAPRICRRHSVPLLSLALGVQNFSHRAADCVNGDRPPVVIIVGAELRAIVKKMETFAPK